MKSIGSDVTEVDISQPCGGSDAIAIDSSCYRDHSLFGGLFGDFLEIGDRRHFATATETEQKREIDSDRLAAPDNLRRIELEEKHHEAVEKAWLQNYKSEKKKLLVK